MVFLFQVGNDSVDELYVFFGQSCNADGGGAVYAKKIVSGYFEDACQLYDILRGGHGYAEFPCVYAGARNAELLC